MTDSGLYGEPSPVANSVAAMLLVRKQALMAQEKMDEEDDE